MRKVLKFSIIINSGYRCKKHNEDIGGSLLSQHLIFATDIRPTWGSGFKKRLNTMLKLAMSIGFRGIGEYHSFIHLDLRKKEVNWIGSKVKKERG